MSSSPIDPVQSCLAPPPGPVLVGFSGGLDSTVLLHALARSPGQRRAGLRAIHVDHGLQPASADWAAHCRAACAALDVPLLVVPVAVDATSGLGIEGAARQARRAAFAEALAPGEWLALAHHRDDQAETFLLRALRASGPDGLAAMRERGPFAAGTVWRPLLSLPRTRLEAWARACGLDWIDDPSNDEDRFDRNFLRHRVLPLLHQRWPQADAALAASAALCAQAGDLLADEDECLLAAAQDARGALVLAALAGQPGARRARVLRLWLARHGAPALPARGTARLLSLMDRPAEQAEAGFAWRGHEVRRWRGALYLLRQPLPGLPVDWQATWDGIVPLALPDGSRLALEGASGGFGQRLLVHARHGGERILLPGRAHSHALKHVLQEAAIPPWQRLRLPLLCAPDGRVLAAGDRLLSAGFDAWLREHGARLRWVPN